MSKTFTDYKRELKLTLENTEHLYKDALAVKNFDWQGEDISMLYMKTWTQINQNASKNIAPELVTDKDVREVHEVIASTAKDLQEEALII